MGKRKVVLPGKNEKFYDANRAWYNVDPNAEPDRAMIFEDMLPKSVTLDNSIQEIAHAYHKQGVSTIAALLTDEPVSPFKEVS